MILPLEWDLPEKIKHRFGQTSPGKQRAMAADGHLLLVLHEAPAAGQDARKAVFFWREPDGQWHCGSGADGIGSLARHVNAYIAAEDKLDQFYDRARHAADYFEILEAVSPLRHAARNLHVTLQAAREAAPDDRELIDLRDWAGNVDRDLDLLYTDTKNALDFAAAKRAEEQSSLGRQALRTGHRLNILAAIFFPLMAVSGIFGMNLTHGLEQSPTWVFWVIFCAGLCLGVLIHAWAVKDPKAGREPRDAQKARHGGTGEGYSRRPQDA